MNPEKHHGMLRWTLRIGLLSGGIAVLAGLVAEAAEQGPRLRFAGQGGGALCLLANRDDDDRDGLADADDDRVNGVADFSDLAAVVIEAADPRITEVALACDAPAIAWFRRDGEGWSRLAADAALPLEAGRADLLVECRTWAAVAPGWDGRATLTAAGRDAAGRELARADLAVEVAPVLIVPETCPVREVYVSRGRYDNDAFVARLESLLDELTVPLRVHEAGAWQEMWMQDTMELGATVVPRRDGEAEAAGMTVVLAGLRGVDPFPPTLLGPDVAVAAVATQRPMAGGDAWADWYGNLMAAPATAAWPQGRVIYGRNVATGEAFHPDLIAFLAAQRVQSPVWIDTSWLLIKHVDEIVAFLPGRDGRGCLVVVDPLAGLEQARAAGLEQAVGPKAAAFAETNRRIAAIVEAMLAGGGSEPRAGTAAGGEAGQPEDAGLLALLGWDPERVVRLPVAFEIPGELPPVGLTDATSLWSNPVNALFVNGTVICGDAGMPAAVIDSCRDAFLAAGATWVEFLDDTCYQRMKGNVHCATNARREW